MEEHGDNLVIGASIVNHNVNKCSELNCGEKFSPYNFYTTLDKKISCLVK